jgi:penicillin-binding protein 1A
MLANGGKKITPTMVEYIQDKHGKVIYKIDERKVVSNISSNVTLPPRLNDSRPQILSEQSIYQLTSLLEGVMQRGSGASANFLNFPMAGKTGTSNESRDTWFVGYTPSVAIGVFVGFDDHSKTLGKNANGANTALPIFIDFMGRAKKYLVAKPFKVPDGIKLRKIDADTGGTPSASSSRIIVEALKEEDEYLKSEKAIEERSSISKLVNEDSSSNEKSIIGIY